VAQECWRILRVGGYVCVRTGTRENDVVVPRFFPAVRAMLDAQLPSADQITLNFVAAGFAAEHHAIITEIVAPDWPAFVRKSALRADSFLARLSDSEFNRGMAALHAHAGEFNPNDAVTEEIDGSYSPSGLSAVLCLRAGDRLPLDALNCGSARTAAVYPRPHPASV
jgi:hypothetical protein